MTDLRKISGVLSVWVMATVLVANVTAQDRITGRTFATRSEVIAQHGMAATSQPLATQVALDILKKGGSAVDAAIAANATLGLMEPTGNGIGGDLFAIVWVESEQKLYGLNASGRSPKSLTFEKLKEELGDRKSIPGLGPLPISVPGCVDGWFELHEKFGKLPMTDVLRPAIKYANEGFPLSELIAYYWGRSAGLRRYPGFAETFLVDGKAPRKGEIFRNPKLANTLRADCRRRKRCILQRRYCKNDWPVHEKRTAVFCRMKDLSEHKSEWVEPVSVDYRGYKLWELPPNGQGIAALQILGVLKGL